MFPDFKTCTFYKQQAFLQPVSSRLYHLGMSSAPTAGKLPANVLMALGAAMAFGLSFELNQRLGGYFAYAQGISLLFFPAGVKLLFVLVGRMPALIGLILMSAYAASGEWPDRPLWSPLSFAVIGNLNYYLAIHFVMRLLRIRADLANLRYWHIVVLSLAASVTNGIIHNFVYLLEGVAVREELWTRATAMALGDFMGCFVVVALFQLSVSRLRLKTMKD